MSSAVLSLGSNVGDRLAHLRGAVDALRPWLVGVSPVYRTPAWGPVRQPAYYNAVLTVAEPGAAPAAWLRRAQSAEQSAGRTREVRWGPRTLDVDVIAVDAEHSDDPRLTLPHPRAAERAFVLVPWLALDPAAVLPGFGAVADLVRALPAYDVAGVVELADSLAG